MGLERIGAAIAAGAASAVERLCAETAENARALCPVESGELKASIAAAVSEGTGSVSAGAGHAAYVELGTFQKEARPFLWPAFAMTREKAADEIAHKIRNARQERHSAFWRRWGAYKRWKTSAEDGRISRRLCPARW